MSRFVMPAVLAALLLSGSPARAAEMSSSLEVWKSPSCGCCKGWVDHMKQAGYSVKANDTASGILAKIKRDAGLKPNLQSCHTGKIGGYVIEGHVPAADVARLLTEKPDAIGLSVPGMPVGSPGMEAGDEKEPYEVLLVRRDGTTEVFARH